MLAAGQIFSTNFPPPVQKKFAMKMFWWGIVVCEDGLGAGREKHSQLCVMFCCLGRTWIGRMAEPS